VTHGDVDEVLGGLTGLDHVAIPELHGLGTLGAELTGHGDLATESLVLHDEPEHTIASPVMVDREISIAATTIVLKCEESNRFPFIRFRYNSHGL
jgi:hypothetical protein